MEKKESIFVVVDWGNLDGRCFCLQWETMVKPEGSVVVGGGFVRPEKAPWATLWAKASKEPAGGDLEDPAS